MPSKEDVRAALHASGAVLEPGLDEQELADIERRYALSFAPDHRLLLSLAVPRDEDGLWPDWRSDDQAELRDRLALPTAGILFDVQNNQFWHPEWGPRPSDSQLALSAATEHLSKAPILAPLFGLRYLPTDPPAPGNPILSCMQTDIIYYGTDILDWFGREFGRRTAHPSADDLWSGNVAPVPFWSWFVTHNERMVEGGDDDEDQQ